MTQIHTSKENVFIYKGSKVKVITVFSDTKDSIALVEDEKGKLFEVLKVELR